MIRGSDGRVFLQGILKHSSEPMTSMSSTLACHWRVLTWRSGLSPAHRALPGGILKVQSANDRSRHEQGQSEGC